MIRRTPQLFVAAFAVLTLLVVNTSVEAQSRPRIVRPELSSSSNLSGQSYIIRPELNSRPHIHSHIHRPTLGFYGYATRDGMEVTRVMRGTEAWRIGLEPGDVIVSIDGERIRCSHDYDRAMRRAGRHIDLLVRDVRGRGTFMLHAHLD